MTVLAAEKHISMHAPSLAFVPVSKALVRAKLARAGEMLSMSPAVSYFWNGTRQIPSKSARD